MEQLSGLAWMTGHLDDQPRIPRGPCDPIAGMHGAFAILVALAERVRTGGGHHVETTLVESALNIAAEQLVERSAYGNLMQRDGNRSARHPASSIACFDGWIIGRSPPLRRMQVRVRAVHTTGETTPLPPPIAAPLGPRRFRRNRVPVFRLNRGII